MVSISFEVDRDYDYTVLANSVRLLSIICDVIGRLSVEPRCNWLERLNSDWCVSIRLQVLGQYVYRRIRWAVL